MQYTIRSRIEYFISTFYLQQMIDLHLTSYSFCCIVESSHHYFVNTIIDFVNEPILGPLYISQTQVLRMLRLTSNCRIQSKLANFYCAKNVKDFKDKILTICTFFRSVNNQVIFTASEVPLVKSPSISGPVTVVNMYRSKKMF